MTRRILILFALVLALAGCASEPQKPLIVEATSQTLAPPPSDKAQIVFLEPINSIQGMFPVGIFEINGADRKLLATTGAHSKVALLFTPGRHLLMANHSGMVSHFLDANVEAGKRYYVLVRFIYGNGFQLRPIRPTGPSDYSRANKDFAKWVSGTRFVSSTPEAEAFFERNKDRVTKNQAEGWQVWLNKTDAERAELTLNPQDSILD